MARRKNKVSRFVIDPTTIGAGAFDLTIEEVMADLEPAWSRRELAAS